LAAQRKTPVASHGGRLLENGNRPSVDVGDGTEARLALEALVDSAGLRNIVLALARFTSDRSEKLKQQGSLRKLQPKRFRDGQIDDKLVECSSRHFAKNHHAWWWHRTLMNATLRLGHRCRRFDRDWFRIMGGRAHQSARPLDEPGD
jgi:hypothetical protein